MIGVMASLDTTDRAINAQTLGNGNGNGSCPYKNFIYYYSYSVMSEITCSTCFTPSGSRRRPVGWEQCLHCQIEALRAFRDNYEKNDRMNGFEKTTHPCAQECRVCWRVLGFATDYIKNPSLIDTIPMEDPVISVQKKAPLISVWYPNEVEGCLPNCRCARCWDGGDSCCVDGCHLCEDDDC